MTVTEPSSPRSDGASDAQIDERGERGVTEIANRVVEKLAVRLTSEVAGVVDRAPVGGLRNALPWQHASSISARADVGRSTARLALTMDIRYPSPVAEVCEGVRAHVSGGLRRLTGLDTTEFEITVRRLVAGRPARRRVE